MARPPGPLVLRKSYENQAFADALQLLLNRMAASDEKYGSIKQNYPIPHHAWRQIPGRVEKYLKTGNTEYLLDVANFALIEYLRPSFPEAFFEATKDSTDPE